MQAPGDASSPVEEFSECINRIERPIRLASVLARLNCHYVGGAGGASDGRASRNRNRGRPRNPSDGKACSALLKARRQSGHADSSRREERDGSLASLLKPAMIFSLPATTAGRKSAGLCEPLQPGSSHAIPPCKMAVAVSNHNRRPRRERRPCPSAVSDRLWLSGKLVLQESSYRMREQLSAFPQAS